IAGRNFSKIDLKEKQSILEYKIDSLAIESLKDSIDKKAYLKIRNSTNVKDFQAYLALHDDSKYRDDVTARRNELAFEEAKLKNTALDYQVFYLQYPNAIEVN